MTELAPTTSRPPFRVSRVLTAGAVVLMIAMLIAAVALHGKTPSTSHYLGLSMMLFTIGVMGVLLRRNALILFMCIELMLNAVNIAFAAFARLYGSVEGHVIVLFVIIVAAAEVAVGLAIIVLIFRKRPNANVDDLSLLRW